MKLSKLAQTDDEIQEALIFRTYKKTNLYRTGYVLCIPHFKRERTDKSTREADTLKCLKQFYQQSHG